MSVEVLLNDVRLQRKSFLENIPNFLMEKNQVYADFINKIPLLINNVKPDHIERRKIFEKIDNEKETSFNLFDDLSIDNKFNEINHSKIIKKILDKNNTVIGDERHLSFLEELIRQKNKKIDDFDTDYIIEKEKEWDKDQSLGKIDIFIYEKKEKGKCIIIENKITGKANDKDNQLARYYEIAEKLNKTVVAIIYLPFYYKYPPIHNFFGKYKEYTKKVKDVLCVIPAIDVNIDFVHGFIDKCVSFAKETNNQTAAVCIEQYSKFLKSKGEKKEMAENCDKGLLEKLLADETTIKIVEDIVDVWKRKDELIYNVLKEKLERLEKRPFHDDEFAFLREFNEDNDVFIYFHDKDFEIGFGHKKKGFSSKLINGLKDILLSKDFISVPYGDKEWVFGYYKTHNLFGTYTDMFTKLLKNINELEEEVGKLLNK
jgi:hypothetical protein